MQPFTSKCSRCHHSTCCRELKIKMRTLPWRPASSGWLWQNSQCARKCCADISRSKWTHTHRHVSNTHARALKVQFDTPALTLRSVDSWKPWQQIGEDLAPEMIVFLTSGLLIKKPWPLTSAGAALCHRAVTLNRGPVAGIARDGWRAARGLSLPFVLTVSPLASCPGSRRCLSTGWSTLKSTSFCSRSVYVS